MNATRAQKKIRSDIKQIDRLEAKEKKELAAHPNRARQIRDTFTPEIRKDKHAAKQLLSREEGKLPRSVVNADRKALGMGPLKNAYSGAAALRVAHSVLGQDIEALKFHGPLAGLLDRGVSDHECCANFVSACLEKTGLIYRRDHQDAVRNLAHELEHNPKWSRVGSLRHAKPGDVVCFNVPGEGPLSHVEMFAGWKNGQPVFIGSNNVNPDGSQRVSEGTVDYPIAAILHYRG